MTAITPRTLPAAATADIRPGAPRPPAPRQPHARPRQRQWTAGVWLPLLVGLCALYLPTLKDLAFGIWGNGEQGHGPIVLTISCWLFYRRWADMQAAARQSAGHRAGWIPLVVGLALYTLGRSQDIWLFEVGSVIWILAGLVILHFGFAALRVQSFSLFFMLFMIPLPMQVVDLVTMPMKIAVSFVAESALYHLGYPIARMGVILQIAQYKLLVADACAGLHTLLTLEALGLLYLNLVRRDSAFRNIGLGLLIIPISFTANVIRVGTLVLVTYYLGDAAGQGFLHAFAGMVLFMSALTLIIFMDTAIQAVDRRLHPPRPAAQGRPA
ncbi:exosortase B [Xylophilus sp. Kf1]|nr:exosortase B [Xylophilus sp. Kf1]